VRWSISRPLRPPDNRRPFAEAVGDVELQVDGKADKAEGNVQNFVVTIKDSPKP
jgi:hypothetical protein